MGGVLGVVGLALRQSRATWLCAHRRCRCDAGRGGHRCRGGATRKQRPANFLLAGAEKQSYLRSHACVVFNGRATAVVYTLGPCDEDT